MMRLMAVLGWEELLASEWYKAMNRTFGELVRFDDGEELPKRGFYAVNLINGDVCGPFDTETGAVGWIVSAATHQRGEDVGRGKRVLH